MNEEDEYSPISQSIIWEAVMDDEYEDRVVSIVRGREGWANRYSTISEFKDHLKEAALAEEELGYAWVLWRENERSEQLQHQIITLLKHMASLSWFHYHNLVQFWAVVKVDGPHHYLSTSHQPFSVGDLSKGLSWYRKVCMDHVYVVDVEGAEQEQLGGVGRAYRNKRPESTPDLRLYSTNEFPLSDQAASCGFTGYLALPVFDFYTNERYGVLEFLSNHPIIQGFLLPTLDRGLQIVELKSTHIDFIPIYRHSIEMENICQTRPLKYMMHPESEIREILELVIKVVPGLTLAQVWVPCTQCADNISTNLCCMERVSFINDQSKIINMCTDIDDKHMFGYLQACEFHNQQMDLNCLRPNLCDLSILNNPLAHHATKARLSLRFPVFLQSVNNSNDLYVIEFFLLPKCRGDACGDLSLHLLLRIIEMKLKSFIFVSREQLPEELVVQSGQPNAIECEAIDMLNVMNSYKETFAEPDFTTYLETSCCLRPSSNDSGGGWVFREKLIENGSESESNLWIVPSSIKEKIEQFMKEIATILKRKYWIIQFWMPKMSEERCYLDTSDQPYALGYLSKGLASFRKECIKHHYFVDKEAKEDELGPSGRVFRNWHPEITPNLFLYSTKEFLMRQYAVHCGLEGYFALPVLEKNKRKCVGVLEFVGFDYCDLKLLGRALRAAKLQSAHFNLRPKFISKQKPANIINCRKEALAEVTYAFYLIEKIPHLHMAKVWVPYDRCASNSINGKCMELALTTNNIWKYMPTNQVHWIHVQPKKGIIGMVMESESKSCFCQNLSEFSIVDQPLAHHQRRERFDGCFAICLQSSHTGDLLYILEFFLNPSPQYVQSFFNFLLPIMKHQLKSFKIASGKQLGEELVVEVIEFSEANNTFSELGQLDVFPIKFKRVQYGQTENQQAEDESLHCVSHGRQTEQGNTIYSDLKKTNRGKRKINLHLSLEDLKPHFGKKLKDVAEELGVGRSTIKRACREYGIYRWPGNEKQARNPSLFERERAHDPHKDMQPSSSSRVVSN